jgi:hypothetical protein
VGQGADAPDDPNAQNAGCLLVAVGLSFLHKVAESQMSQQLTHSPGIGFTSQHMYVHDPFSSVNTKMQFFSESFKYLILTGLTQNFAKALILLTSSKMSQIH